MSRLDAFGGIWAQSEDGDIQQLLEPIYEYNLKNDQPFEFTFKKRLLVSVLVAFFAQVSSLNSL